MTRSILLAMAVFCSCGSTTNAEDYLLRVDTIGYVNVLTSEVDPKETVLSSVEAVVRPDSPFHSKVLVGTHTVEMSGKLSMTDNDNFEVSIRYEHVVDAGRSVLKSDGKRVRVIDVDLCQTKAVIAVGESLNLCVLDSAAIEEGKPERHSKIRFEMVLTKYTPI